MGESWVDKLAKLYLDSIMHSGVAHDENPPGRGSGLYPWGSGERPYQRQWDIYSSIQKYRLEGKPEVEIAKLLGFYKTDKRGNILRDENGEPMGNTATLRARAQVARNVVRSERVRKVIELSETIDPDTDNIYTNKKIAEIVGLPGESSVRNLLKNEKAATNTDKTQKAADELKRLVDQGKAIDVGRGTELYLGVSPDRLKTALDMLKEEGYSIQTIQQEQVGMNNGEKTWTKVLLPPGSTIQDAYRLAKENGIRSIQNADGTGPAVETLLGTRDPVRVDMSRIEIRYAEDHGKDKDGVVEIRAKLDENGNLVSASPDLSLGNAKYAQVRIAVEGDKYIKGMAVYNTDLPEGTDILVNSNKSVKGGPDEALKDLKKDPLRPFGATVFQSEYEPGKLSAINIVGDPRGHDIHQEGAWDEWSTNLPAQFLSKQSLSLINQQLNLKIQQKEQEYEEILKINNPVVKKKMLIDFADGCDASAVDLKAAALPGQRVQVLLPLTTSKDTEVYAPNYPDGTTLALIRYPHAGAFEIPIVKVNNQIPEAKKFLEDARGQAKDAIGVSPTIAEILSGADYDGDNATCIPMTRKNSQGEFEKTVNIKGIGNGQHRLQGLVGFDPQAAYPYREGMKVMTARQKGIEMGVVSNLITDMQIKGNVTDDELERAVKYSMVVIDAQKHKLDYTRAEKEYRIKELKEKYQSNADGTHGTSTLISRAKSTEPVEQREKWNPDRKWVDSDTGKVVSAIDPETGAKNYKLKDDRFYDPGVKVKKLAEPGYTWTDKDGKTHKSKYVKDENGNDVYETRKTSSGREVTLVEPSGNLKVREVRVSKMSNTNDAMTLLSDNPSPKEIAYGNYANKMKSMANEARKEYLSVPKLEYSPEARKKYAEEVNSLDDKLIKAKMNAPLEREAQRLATQRINSKIENNPDMSADDIKRVKGQELESARKVVGAQKDRVRFTEQEWEAINAGAISEHKLEQLLVNADADNYKALATPRESRVSASTAARVQSYLDQHYTRNQISEMLGVSVDTVKEVEKGNFEH